MATADTKILIAFAGLAVGAIAVFFAPKASLFASLTTNGQIETRGLSAIRESLVDPGSAQFDSVKVIESSLGPMVCGRVNSKNRMGGYVGAVPFTYVDGNRATCIAKDYRDAFVCGTYLKHCFPAMRIPANAGEADNWDRYGVR